MFDSFVFDLFIKYIIAIVLVLFRGVLLTLSVYFYNKHRGKQEKISVYIFTFIFGLLAVVCYAVRERKAKTAVDISKGYYKIVSLILFILYLISFVGGSAFLKTYYPISNENINEDKSVYYDMYGNNYSSADEVVFYTKDGCRFIRNDESGAFVRLDENQLYNKEYTLFVSYVDTNGYLVFVDEILSVDSEKANAYELLCLYDENGNYYAMAGNVKWDSYGNMLHKSE